MKNCSKIKSYQIQKRFILLFIFLSQLRFLNRLLSDLILEAVYLKIFIVDKTHLPKFFLNLKFILKI